MFVRSICLTWLNRPCWKLADKHLQEIFLDPQHRCSANHWHWASWQDNDFLNQAIVKKCRERFWNAHTLKQTTSALLTVWIRQVISKQYSVHIILHTCITTIYMAMGFLVDESEQEITSPNTLVSPPHSTPRVRLTHLQQEVIDASS